ncbi:sensor domain-containing phosphodiesterase [Tropicibacter sp. S64]|uniref:sensor domain-containing phosphodiesterase n=1 Tax=Tropicibacter sp. S64 TaxID=3415122 RepID=UPI003C7BEC3D
MPTKPDDPEPQTLISHDFREALSTDVGNKPENLRWKKRRILKALREMFDMDAAFISRFIDTDRVFEEVDMAPGDLPFRLQPGTGSDLTTSYCYRIALGITPELIAEAGIEPTVADIAETFALPVGGHISVPIRLSTGAIYGMLCAFSRQPKPDLTERDLAVFTLCAELLARDIEAMAVEQVLNPEDANQLQRALEKKDFRFFVQPIVSMSENRALGYELLTRFPERLGLTEDIFRRAKYLDMMSSVEEVIARGANEVLECLPDGVFLSINFSVSSIEDLDFASIFRPQYRNRVVIEITEHEKVPNYESFGASVDALRALGFRIAIDDVGAGYSSLRHVLVLHPDYIKLDRSLVRGIDKDSERSTLVSALRAFARLQRAKVIAEGIETDGELAEIKRLGIDKGQGYRLGQPVPYRDALAPPPS